MQWRRAVSAGGLDRRPAVRHLGGDRLPPRAAPAAVAEGPADVGAGLISIAASRAGGGHVPRGTAAPETQLDAEQAMAARVGKFDVQALRREFADHGAFLYLPDFLAPAVTEQLVARKSGRYKN